AGKHPSDPRTGWDPAWNAALQNYLPMTTGCGNSAHKTWTDMPGVNENLAINCVYWIVALAFCAWDHGRLPTEAEWQYAATIDRERKHRMYPWGTARRAARSRYIARPRRRTRHRPARTPTIRRSSREWARSRLTETVPGGSRISRGTSGSGPLTPTPATR